MKTIKERATIACNNISDNVYIHSSVCCEDAYKDGYADGAIEQKAIDIEKAYDWIINTYLGDYVTDEYGNGGIGDNVKLAEDFRKAMEE